MKKLWTLLIALFLLPSAWATTYNFSGAVYDTLTPHTTSALGSVGDFTTTMRVTGSFTTAAPLAANLPGNVITSLVTSYSFTDGLVTYASTDANTYGGVFTVATNNTGAITLALINIGQWQAGPHDTTAGRVNRFSIFANGSTQAFHNQPCSAVTGDACTATPVFGATPINSNTSQANSPGTANTWTTVADAVVAPVVNPVPTLSEWGMIFLSSLIAMVGIATMRRRNGGGR